MRLHTYTHILEHGLSLPISKSLSLIIVLLPSELKLYLSKETIEYCITDTKVLFIQWRYYDGQDIVKKFI